jgi:tetratricopeptide (TPR) repeat protein
MVKATITWPLVVFFLLATSLRALAAPEAQVSSPKHASPVAKDTSPYATQAVVYYNHALELQIKGSLAEAALEYQKAVAADKRIHQAWDNLGLIYIGQKKHKEALAAFENSLQIAPDRPVPLNGYASVLLADGRREEAVEVWRKLIRIHPSFTAAYQNLSECLISMGRYQEAIEVLKEGGIDVTSPTGEPRPKIFDDCKQLPPRG